VHFHLSAQHTWSQLYACLPIICPFCISHCPQLAQLGQKMQEREKACSITHIKYHLHTYIKVIISFPNYIPLFYMSMFMLVPHCFDFYTSVISFEIRKCETSKCVLKRLFSLLHLLRFHTNFRMDFSISTKAW
jgi:hypothetical protein